MMQLAGNNNAYDIQNDNTYISSCLLLALLVGLQECYIIDHRITLIQILHDRCISIQVSTCSKSTIEIQLLVWIVVQCIRYITQDCLVILSILKMLPKCCPPTRCLQDTHFKVYKFCRHIPKLATRQMNFSHKIMRHMQLLLVNLNSLCEHFSATYER